MRRKNVPCACDPCKGKNYVRAVNNVSPDPNGDLTIRGGSGIEVIQSGDDLVINNTANPNAFIAGNNIELNPSGDDIAIELVDEPVVDGLTVNGDTQINGDTQLNGDLEVNGDIIQNGAAYETHAEQVYTRDDYIIMRDGAVSGLPQGDYSGLQVKLYDGVNDGRLVIDNTGVARVGDVGDEQPLLTRDEATDLTDGECLVWDSANAKAVTETIPSDIAIALAGKQNTITPSSTTLTVGGMTITKTVYGKIVVYDFQNQTTPAAGDYVVDNSINPYGYPYQPFFSSVDYTVAGTFFWGNGLQIRVTQGGKAYCGGTIAFMIH